MFISYPHFPPNLSNHRIRHYILSTIIDIQLKYAMGLYIAFVSAKNWLTQDLRNAQDDNGKRKFVLNLCVFVVVSKF